MRKFSVYVLAAGALSVLSFPAAAWMAKGNITITPSHIQSAVLEGVVPDGKPVRVISLSAPPAIATVPAIVHAFNATTSMDEVASVKSMAASVRPAKAARAGEARSTPAPGTPQSAPGRRQAAGFRDSGRVIKLGAIY